MASRDEYNNICWHPGESRGEKQRNDGPVIAFTKGAKSSSCVSNNSGPLNISLYPKWIGAVALVFNLKNLDILSSPSVSSDRNNKFLTTFYLLSPSLL